MERGTVWVFDVREVICRRVEREIDLACEEARRNCGG